MTIKTTAMQAETHSTSHFPLTPVDVLIHLGAGRCSELDDYLTLKPERIVLVEADPRLVTILNARVVEMPSVEVIQQAVSGQAGSQCFYRYNQPDTSSLHAPGPELLKVFPGLRTLEEINLETMAPSTLLAQLNLQENRVNRLVIDIPGEELSVLKSLNESDHLQFF